MNVELSGPQQGARAVAGADSVAKKLGRSGGTAADVDNGFTALMSSLASEEAKPVDLPAELPQAGQEPLPKVDLTAAPSNVLTSSLFVLLPIEVPLVVPGGAADAATVDAPQVAIAVSLSGSDQHLAINADNGAVANALDTAAPQNIASTTRGNALADDIKPTGGAVPELTSASPVSAWLAHRSALQAQGLGVAQQVSQRNQKPADPALAVNVADVPAAWAMGQGESVTGVRPQNRFASATGLGSPGLEGVFGGTAAGTHRSESVFEVPATSSVVADTAVAETVSFWASHGVQTAELTLDGFGDTPVEVSIVINGDQAQIDFRSDQTAVRQVIEGATAQLKELLSNQGLLLTGVSVGSSGKGGGNGDERRQRSGNQQVKLVKSDLLSPSAARVANAAVGQSLDLFV